ncbi:MAG TPA: ABC transporter substrate-binding protein [Bryobacteraceae bacterium]|jgi:putative ABC transport system substrate-binding protein|nr:ABC transporter substrate-binding protein [Bryobacteraceae bacterium]
MQFDRLRRRDFVALLGGAAAWPLAARAQQPGKLPLIGALVSASPPHPFADAFWRGLHALGYSEDRNIKVEFRYTDGRSDRAEEYAEEFVRLGVDVIVAHFVPAVEAAMGATRTIPIVMAPHGAPLQLGAIDSLNRPGGNVTGLSAMDAEIGGKRLQVLRELIPNLGCVAVLATTATTTRYSGPFVEDVRSAAAKAGIRLEPILIGGPSELRAAFAAMAKAGAQAVIVQPFFDPHHVIIIDLAAKYRIAYMSGSRDVTAAGGLVSMAANWPELYERAAFYVDKILKGAKPADLPVEQPTKFDVTLNMKTAKALGLTSSPTLLAQIDEVFE